MSETDPLAELRTTIVLTQAILSHLSTSLTGTYDNPPTSDGKTAHNALALASTSAALIKAQTTKVTLLATHQPFTPSAINAILKTLSSNCFPALATAVQLASASDRYPHCVQAALKEHSAAVFLEFQNLLKEIPTDEDGVVSVQNRGRDALASTGVVWNAVDQLVVVGEKGAGEVAAGRATLSLGLIKDAIEELKEWLEDDEDGDTSHKVSDDEQSNDSDDENGLIEAMMGGKCPSQLRPLAGQAVELVEHIRLLFPPILKRRLRRFPALTAKTKPEDLPITASVGRLDAIGSAFKELSEEVDELAGFLYDGDWESTLEQIEKLSGLASNCATTAADDWEGQPDELTAWLSEKWTPTLQRVSKTRQTHVRKE